MSNSRRHRSYGSQVAFIDLLFNTLVGFVFLFVMAFILINPVAKKSNVELNAEFIITMKWPQDHNSFLLGMKVFAVIVSSQKYKFLKRSRPECPPLMIVIASSR